MKLGMHNRILETDLDLFGGDVVQIPEISYMAISTGNREALINNTIAYIFKTWDDLIYVEDDMLTHEDLKAKLFMKEHFKLL